MPEEEKNKKREYEKNRYYTMLEEKNKKRVCKKQILQYFRRKKIKKESMQEIDIT